MPIRLVTLDCANTLLKGSWDPVRFALEAARAVGLRLPPDAGETYHALLRDHYPEILAANRTGDPAVVRESYVRLGRDWLGGMGLDPGLASSVVDEAARRLPGLYEPFADTIPFLVEARGRGLRLAVVSNWDVSLSRVLAAHGLDTLVDDAYASLVVGAEKPDPTMIRLAMAAAGVAPDETLHVGDSPVDDLGAAESAGVRGLLLDRSRSSPLPSGGEGAGGEGSEPQVDLGHSTVSETRRNRAVGSLMEVLDWTA